MPLTWALAPGTAEDAPEAVQDVEALARAVQGRSGTLVAGAPLLLGRCAPAGAIARVACAADRMPEAAAAVLDAMGEVWVPGRFAHAALERSGVDRARLRVVSPVVDTGAFSPEAPGRPPEGARGFVFLAILDWTRASGWDVLVRAWAEEFGPDEDVSLVLRASSALGYTPAVVGEALVGELLAAGHEPGAIGDLILEVSPSFARPEPGAYRGADCFVAPARGDAWGRRLLEALASGLPAIATAAGPAGELLAPGAALPLASSPVPVDAAAGREVPALSGARWAEPDRAELRRLMRAAVTDRAGLAAIGAQARRHAVACHGGPRVVPPAVSSPPAARRRRPPAAGADPRDVSFVLQGPVERNGRGRTALACAAVRAHFSGAEVVVSTWEGTDVTGLDCDRVVHSADPGAVGTSPYNANTNRQIVSSLAGVRATSRPLVAKLRSDLLFLDGRLLGHWDRWTERTDELAVFERRVLVPNVFMRRPSHLSPFPLHPSDWSFLGTRGDLETLFDVPLMHAADTETWAPLPPLAQLYHPRTPTPTHTPEQWIWTRALRKADPALGIRHVFDLTPETLRRTEVAIANNFAVLDTYLQYGAWCPKYPWPNRLFEDFTLYQHGDWRALYDRHCRGIGPATDPADVQDLLGALAAGARGAPEDVARLRAAGLHWEAQLLESVLARPTLRRDSTTGTDRRFALDAQVAELAARELAERADAQLGTAARTQSPSRA